MYVVLYVPLSQCIPHAHTHPSHILTTWQSVITKQPQIYRIYYICIHLCTSSTLLTMMSSFSMAKRLYVRTYYVVSHLCIECMNILHKHFTKTVKVILHSLTYRKKLQIKYLLIEATGKISEIFTLIKNIHHTEVIILLWILLYHLYKF